MIVTKELESHLRKENKGFIKAFSIKADYGRIRIDFVKAKQLNEKSPIEFVDETTYLDLKIFKRDMILSSILESKLKTGFNVEEYIYNDEQRLKIEKLRNDNKDLSSKKCSYNFKRKLEKDYSDTFYVGQKVWFKRNKRSFTEPDSLAGVITFKHQDKTEKEWDSKSLKNLDVEAISQYSVKVNNVEYRYIYGTNLVNRIPEKIKIPIDKELDKLSTEKLLKIFKYKRNKNRGQGDLKIKAILNQREHIQKGETIIK